RDYRCPPPAVPRRCNRTRRRNRPHARWPRTRRRCASAGSRTTPSRDRYRVPSRSFSSSSWQGEAKQSEWPRAPPRIASSLTLLAMTKINGPGSLAKATRARQETAMVPLSFAGEELALTSAQALYWPRERALLVADLHLEKASFYARHGQPLPPYDSRET